MDRFSLRDFGRLCLWPVEREGYGRAELRGVLDAGKPHAGMLWQAQYRSARGRLGNWQCYRDGEHKEWFVEV